MKFTKVSEITKAIKLVRASKTTKNCHYPVAIKKAICVYLGSKPASEVEVVRTSCEIKNSTLYNWLKQYKEGLYEPDAVYAVSKKSKSIVLSVREKLSMQLTAIQRKIELIEQCEALGFKVSA